MGFVRYFILGGLVVSLIENYFIGIVLFIFIFEIGIV
jgi:hypothetical protein